MTLNDIVALASAGFSAEQISRLASAPAPTTHAVPTTAPTTQIVPTTQTVPTTAPTTQVVPAPTPTPAPAFGSTSNGDINSRIDALISTIQGSNILNNNQPKTETTDDILAGILMPNGREMK